jgi:hypothetical protein
LTNLDSSVLASCWALTPMISFGAINEPHQKGVIVPARVTYSRSASDGSRHILQVLRETDAAYALASRGIYRLETRRGHQKGPIMPLPYPPHYRGRRSLVVCWAGPQGAMLRGVVEFDDIRPEQQAHGGPAAAEVFALARLLGAKRSVRLFCEDSTANSSGHR